MPRISVLLPCRNAAAFLHPCIESLRAQTFADFEVIAIDDASADNTGAILRDWAQSDARVRVCAATGTGLVDALNHGAARVTGDLIARMDADDVAHPDRFVEQVALFDNDAKLAACGTQVRYFPREQVLDGARRYEAWVNSLTEPEQLERDMFVECPIAHPTLMIRADVFQEVGGYQQHGWPEDYDLVLRLFATRKRMRNAARVLLDWRERPDRLSRTDESYSQHAFRACKVHYLARTLLRERDTVVICGAGPIGKAFAKLLQQEGKRVVSFVEVDPRKIGQTIHAAPVVALDELATLAADHFAIAAVSGQAPRAQIRALLLQHGQHELRDFVAVA